MPSAAEPEIGELLTRFNASMGTKNMQHCYTEYTERSVLERYLNLVFEELSKFLLVCSKKCSYETNYPASLFAPGSGAGQYLG